MRKIVALAKSENVAFMQFTGDMVNGYSLNIDRKKINVVVKNPDTLEVIEEYGLR